MLTERMKGQHILIPQILGVSVTRGAGRAETMSGKKIEGKGGLLEKEMG